MAKKDLIKRADGSYSPRGLWDNIRANAGSGKKPTKEMLAQEKKINKMAKGGKMSSFKASNIQTYAEGGVIGDPDLPLNIKHGINNGSFIINPFYNNSPTGAIIPQTSIGFTTAPQNPQKGGWSITGRIGKEYPALNAMMDPYSEAFQKEIPFTTSENYLIDGSINEEWNQSQAQETADKYNEKAKFRNNMRPILPGALKNVSYGLNATYKGKVGLDGQKFIPEAGIRADYSQSGGLGVAGTAGFNYKFGKHNYRQGQLRDGYAAGIAGPYVTYGINALSGPSLNYGAKAEIDYRPKFFGDMPGMLYGKGSAQFNVAGANSNLGFMPQFSGEVGYKLPMSKVKQIDLPHISMPDTSPLTSFLGRANKGGEENLQMQGGDPYGDFGSRINASPIDKRWNKNAEDIYIPSTQSGSNVEPIIYDPNDPEGLIQNNFKQGGAMNFKSPAAYKAWLAYGHATGEFAKTPGNQKVSIGGKAHNVKHAMGGHVYSMGGRAFADGGQLTEFNEGGSHEMNPLGGIPQGFAQDGKLNLVEQGETKLNAADYIFSDQIKVSKETATLYDLPKGDIGKTFADVSKKLNRPNSRRENDTIEQVAIQRDLENLMQAQEQQKESEKQVAIEEMQAKYPDVQVIDQAAMAEQQAMAEEMAMQQQQQLAPPAGMPQEIDPAMMQQMQQQGILRMGGKMCNMGGHLYGAGGGMMALRGVGSAAYGIGEGMLDTLTFGLTDNLTDKGYTYLSGLGHVDERQAGRLDATRGFGNTVGAIVGGVVSQGSATKSAISEGAEGLSQGIASLPSTGEKADQVAMAINQGASLYGSLAGGPPKAGAAKTAEEGSKAVNKLMAASQNKFINQAVKTAGNFMAQGGYLGAHTTGMFTNQFVDGSFLDPSAEPKVIFNIQGVPVSLTIEEALNNPTILESFMPDGADVDGDGNFSNEDIAMARAALEQHYANFSNSGNTLNTVSTVNTDNIVTADEEGDDTDLLDVERLAQEDAAIISAAAANGLVKPEGITDDEWASELKKMSTRTDKKEGLGEMKANPIIAGITALPAIYNIGRGLFGKVDQLDAKDYQSRARITPYEMNVDPQLAAARGAYGTAMQAARNAASGAGSYLSTLNNIASTRQQAIRDIYAQKENFDKNQKLEADKFNAQVEQGNMAQDLAIQQYNAQARAAKQNMLATGLTQASDMAQGWTTKDLQEKYLQMIAPDYAGNFRYMSIPEQIAAAAAANKANKTQNS